ACASYACGIQPGCGLPHSDSAPTRPDGSSTQANRPGRRTNASPPAAAVASGSHSTLPAPPGNGTSSRPVPAEGEPRSTPLPGTHSDAPSAAQSGDAGG